MPKSLKKFVPVEGFEDYMVDPYGRVYSKKVGRLMKPSYAKDGYFRVGLRKLGTQYNCFVHRLVALAFMSNTENKKQVNNISGVKTDNRVTNLEWSTSKENVSHSIDTGLRVVKLSLEDVHRIWQKVDNPVSQTAEEFGIAKSSVHSIYNGQCWKDVYEEYKHLKPKKFRHKSSVRGLTIEEIEYIRHTEGLHSSRRIAKDFGISQFRVLEIRNRRGRYSDI